MEEQKPYKGRTIKIAVIHISLGGFMSFYTLGVFNTCSESVAASLNWGSNKDLYVSLFSTFITIGQTIGGLTTPYLLGNLGRQKSLIMSCIVFIVGSCFIVLPHTSMFAIGRLLTGYTTGIMSNINPIYINEITPEEMIGTMGPLLVLITAAGLVFSYAFGLMLPTENYETASTNYLWVIMFIFVRSLEGGRYFTED